MNGKVAMHALSINLYGSSEYSLAFVAPKVQSRKGVQKTPVMEIGLIPEVWPAPNRHSCGYGKYVWDGNTPWKNICELLYFILKTLNFKTLLEGIYFHVL